ncbi:HDOD domain-containing protein [Balneatrix alpica]|uniref:HDOD domain-containing protein n=1 Tax=Balneatrix alpica TaxID=75684 RepID=A0ABV5ZAP2_9GAMM|nr:HDOD domain-containing protein [Balneatrix alpica]
MSRLPARVVILEDSKGKVLVLLPEHQLLHLVLLNRFSERPLRALAFEQCRRVFVPALLQQPSMLQKLFKLPVILDHSLSKADSLDVFEPISGQRFLLDASLYSDHAQVFRFAIDPSQLKARLPEGNDEQVIVQAVDKFTSLRMQERLQDTLEIPPLPGTAKQIINLCSDPEAGINALVPVVEADPSLAAQVISWAASPYYAAPGKIQSVKDAIVRVLGYDLVMNLALGLALSRTLQVPEEAPRGFSPYWKQAVCAATAIEALVKLMPPALRPSAGLSYLSGLLHNFGYLVMAHVFPPHFGLLCRSLECNPNITPPLVEQQLLGISREQIGAWLLQAWQLPDEVCVAMRHQHDGEYQGPHSVYANLLHLTLGLLREQGIGHAPGARLAPSAFDRLGLHPEDCRAAISALLEAQESLEAMAEKLATPVEIPNRPKPQTRPQPFNKRAS